MTRAGMAPRREVSQTKTTEAGNVPAAVSALSGGTSRGAMSDGSEWNETVKPLGAFMTEDHRYYWNGQGPMPSVTTVLKVLDKPAVTRWYGREIAKAAWYQVTALGPNGEAVPKFPGGDVNDWVKFLEAQPREITDVAAKLGSSVHVLADMEARGSQTAATGQFVPDEAQPYLQAFRGFLGFLEAQGGTIVSSEHAVFSLTEGYAGTYDLLVSLEGALWLIDVKTSRGYYPEYALQLAGYGYAEFIGLPGDPTKYPMPKVDRYGVLHLRPDQYPDTGWRLIEYPVRDTDYMAFLASLYIYKWKGEGRFTRSILKKAIYAGQLDGIGTDPLATE